MSWGFYLDLDLHLPTLEWRRLQSTTGSALPSGWWGFEDADLERRFGGGHLFADATFARVFSFWKHARSCSKLVTEQDGVTSVRLIAFLDRSGDTEVAKPVAALFDAAAKVGGVGHIQLVNDGSYSGEDGVCLTIDHGTLVRARLTDARPLSQALSSAVYGPMEALLQKYTLPRVPSADTEARAKKTSAKKTGAKKTSAKTTSAKTTGAKKTSAKKTTAKTSAKKTAM